jgi:type I restriction enzyme S subunit
MNSDHEIELLEQELEAWQQKKKALMQLLLTGLVRVNA